MKTKQIGIGSPQQLDQAGWIMIDEIAKIPLLTQHYELLKLDRPGLRLVEEIENCEKVVIYDAAIGLAPGEFQPVDSNDYYNKFKPVSSHGVGVIEALEMAKILNKYPKALTLVAIGAGDYAAVKPAIKAYIAQILFRQVENA